MMDTLFPLEPVGPPGFSYYQDFITAEEEAWLITQVDQMELHPMQFQGYEAKRLVASFGYDWSFHKRVLTKGKDIPGAFKGMLEKVGAFLSVSPSDFGELLLTRYPAGAVINWHRDAPPFDIIAGISLKAGCPFKFRPHEKAKQGRGTVITLPVSRRSLYVMSGASRTEWQHSIPALKEERISITLRTLRPTT